MKKIFYAFILLSFLFVSCGESDTTADIDQLKKEINELKAALAANSKITNVEFKDDQMILTFSNGLKIGTEIPDCLKGEDGKDGVTPHIGDDGNWWIGDKNTGVNATGKEGVGIKEITYNKETNTMTIILTNGQKSEFVISTTDDGLSAAIKEDLNGAYYITKVTQGDLPYIEIEYTDDFKIKKLTYNTSNGYNILKTMEIEKEYNQAGKVCRIKTNRYALKQNVEYKDEYVENKEETDYKNNYQEDTLDVKKEKTLEDNGDGTYTYYKYVNYNYTQDPTTGESKTTYLYHVYKQCLVYNNSENQYIHRYKIQKDGKIGIYSFLDQTYYDNNYTYILGLCNTFDKYIISPERKWEQSKKIAEGKFEIYRNAYYDNLSSENGEVKYLLVLRCIRTITGVFNTGDLTTTEITEVSYDSDNKIEKIYKLMPEGTPCDEYCRTYYNNAGFIQKTEFFYKEDGKEIKSPKYIKYNYTADNLLTETVRVDNENEITVGKIDYDSENNPVEIFRYVGDVYNYYWDYNIDPETGLDKHNETLITESGLYSFAKIEYNYSMKNYFGNTFSVLFPELYPFNYNNAFKRVSISNTINAGAMEYKDFNEGGYPETIEFIGYGEDGSYLGQLKIEYLKKEK